MLAISYHLIGGIQGIGLKKAEEVFTKTMKTDLKEVIAKGTNPV